MEEAVESELFGGPALRGGPVHELAAGAVGAASVLVKFMA